MFYSGTYWMIPLYLPKISANLFKNIFFMVIFIFFLIKIFYPKNSVKIPKIPNFSLDIHELQKTFSLSFFARKICQKFGNFPNICQLYPYKKMK